jgi:hypothetical protein
MVEMTPFIPLILRGIKGTTLEGHTRILLSFDTRGFRPCPEFIEG